MTKAELEARLPVVQARRVPQVEAVLDLRRWSCGKCDGIDVPMHHRTCLRREIDEVLHGAGLPSGIGHTEETKR